MQGMSKVTTRTSNINKDKSSQMRGMAQQNIVKKHKELPLQSIKIVDFTRLIPGPFCTQMLADYGADIIKIEEPNKGDYTRGFRTEESDEYGVLFATLNRNKKSFCVDLKTENGRKIVKKLIEDADVLMESFRPNVMKKMGFDYESVKKYNPRLIYCSITGYGQYGPCANKAGHDINFMSYSGVLDTICRSNDNDISKMTLLPFQLSDVVGGLNSVIAVLLALKHRDSCNEGQYIDISLMDATLINCLQWVIPKYYRNNQLPTAYGNITYGKSANYSVYETADKRGLVVGALEPKFWGNFCSGINRPDLISCIDDNERLFMIKDEIQQIIKNKTLKQWMDIFERIDACVSPVLRLDELESNEHIMARNLIDKQAFPPGNIKVLETSIKFSSIFPKDKEVAPTLGENAQEILCKYGS